MNIEPTVTPYQLCQICQPVAAEHTPISSWSFEDFVQEKIAGSGMNERLKAEIDDLRKVRKRVPDLTMYFVTRSPIMHCKGIGTVLELVKWGCPLCSIFSATPLPYQAENCSAQLYMVPHQGPKERGETVVWYELSLVRMEAFECQSLTKTVATAFVNYRLSATLRPNSILPADRRSRCLPGHSKTPDGGMKNSP